jgi:hypothetical protein
MQKIKGKESKHIHKTHQITNKDTRGEQENKTGRKQ